MTAPTPKRRKAKREWELWCPQCGAISCCDQDGTCALCGADTIRPEVLRAIRRVPAPKRRRK
jgi:ribosomal protein L37E